MLRRPVGDQRGLGVVAPRRLTARWFRSTYGGGTRAVRLLGRAGPPHGQRRDRKPRGCTGASGDPLRDGTRHAVRRRPVHPSLHDGAVALKLLRQDRGGPAQGFHAIPGLLWVHDRSECQAGPGRASYERSTSDEGAPPRSVSASVSKPRSSLATASGGSCRSPSRPIPVQGRLACRPAGAPVPRPPDERNGSLARTAFPPPCGSAPWRQAGRPRPPGARLPPARLPTRRDNG